MGVSFDERLATGGSFLRDSGAEAMRALLGTGRPFDALFCMNDRMALGAMEVLRERGIRVPHDVAVAGFDGIEEGRYLTPPLTTVMQPLAALGSRAVDLLVSSWTAAPRESGCSPARRSSASPAAAPEKDADADRAAPPESATPQERRAIERLAALARRGDAEGFIARLDRPLPPRPSTATFGRWNDYLSVVRTQRRFPRGTRPARPRRPSSSLPGPRGGGGEPSPGGAARGGGEDGSRPFARSARPLRGAFEMPVMLRRLEDGLARLGIGRGYIVLFDRDGPTRAGRAWSSRPAPPPRRRRPRGPAVPHRAPPPASEGEEWRGGHWVLEPLVFQNEPLGYILLPGGAEEPAVYDTLREQVASALKGALLLEQVLTHERRLQAEVARRTAELTRANRDLTLEVERRRRLEQEVSEISNRTMQRIGQDLHDDLCQHLAGIAMLASVLRGALSDRTRRRSRRSSRSGASWRTRSRGPSRSRGGCTRRAWRSTGW